MGTSKWAVIGVYLLAMATLRGEEVLDLAAFEVMAGWEGEGNRDGFGGLGEGLLGEVRVDLQSRGGTRYQTDVAVRGGIFEGTGLQVGVLAIVDPQTGHYGLEVPLDRRFLEGPRLLTGSNHALDGFNATAGSLRWEWAEMTRLRETGLLVGTDGALGGRNWASGVGESSRWVVSVEAEQGDGSVEGGDYALEQVSAVWAGDGGAGTLRLFGGHLRKAYGWPGMYTGNARLKEFETYTVGLVGVEWAGAAGHRFGGYWRYLEDDYEFNRLAPNRFFEHATQVLSVQGDGGWRTGDWGLRYRWVWMEDRVIRSTSLRSGAFSERRYGKVAARASRFGEAAYGEWELYGGGVMDVSEEEETSLLPHAGVRATGEAGQVGWTAYAELSGTSRVPGYTALKSAPQGLFGGNAGLGRETAWMLETGLALAGPDWQARAVVFRRQDRDLVDWVYAMESRSVRQAQAIDGTVDGLEASWEAGWAHWRMEAGYAWLSKAPDYDPGTGGSFYYLNYARHRLAVRARREFGDHLAVVAEASTRQWAKNPLRVGAMSAVEFGLSLRAREVWREGLTVELRGDNLFAERYERVPGTPGPGREVRLEFSYAW